MALFRARRFEEAIAQYRNAIEADPTSPLSHRNLATVRMHQRQFEAALESIRAAQARGADDIHLLLDKGTSSRELGDLPTARSTLQKLLSAGPWPMDFKSLDTLSRAKYELGLIALETGDTDVAAITWFRHTLSLNSGFVQARYHLSRALVISGRETEAWDQTQRFEADAVRVAAIQGGLSKNAGRVEALRYVASTYELLGSYALAAAHYRQLLAREPGNLELAASLRRLRERVEAIQ